MISIVVTSYNYCRYVGAAVESALAQTLPCEVIVVDDGSTDDSLKVLEAFGDQIVLVKKSNGGEASAMYAGLLRASGDAIIFLDSDDVLYPRCAETVAPYIAAGVSKIQYRLDAIGADGQSRNRPFPHYPPGLTPEEVLRMRTMTGRYPTPTTSGNALTREFLTKIFPIPDPEFRNNADGYTNTLAPLYGRVISVPAILGAYRVHGDNNWFGHGTKEMWSVYARHDYERQRIFVEHASRLGIPVPKDALFSDPGHLECRMLSLRLSPDSHPFPQDRRVFLFRESVRGLAKASYLPQAGRLVWVSYLVFITFAPSPVLRYFLPRLRGLGSGWWLPHLIIAFSRLRMTWLLKPSAKPKQI